MSQFSKKTPRRPGLDLLRSIAIILVMFHHFRTIPGCPGWLDWVSMRGYIGVDIFFVLSGWLIGSQLFREIETTGQVNLFRFWKRRWLRTLPPYFAMLILFICTHRNQFGFLPIASVFLQNYLAPSKWLISWSLCVEEHFYIVLPVLVMITHNLNRWIIFLTALFFVFISSLLRFRLFPMMQISGYNSFIEYFYVPTHLRLDSLSLGVLLAALYIFKPKEWSILLQLKRSLAILGVIIVLFWGWSPWISGTGAAGLGRMQFLPAVPGFLVLGLGTSFIIPWAFTRAWTGRLADFAKLIAEYAYVLYLCHTPAIGLTVRVTKHSSYSFVASLALASATTAGMAFLLRNFIEVPALTLREKLLAPRPKSNAVST